VGIHEEEFHLSIPHIGRLITSINKTRSFVLSVLKRTKYKEILESQLKKLKLRDSCFKLDYHLAEMEGGGLIRRTKLTTDHLIGIVQD
jgi:hypothetical protein